VDFALRPLDLTLTGNSRKPENDYVIQATVSEVKVDGA
jgi:hypothetical protein